MTQTKPNRSLTTTTALSFERPLLEMEQKIEELAELASSTHLDLTGEIEGLQQQLDKQTAEAYSGLTSWDRVGVARHPNRPLTSDYIDVMLEDFCELSGDRLYSDDKAIVCGLATMADKRFMLIGHRKGRTVKERLACNFGCAHPEGYRKALIKMRLAERMKLPIVCLVDTQGAYPGIGAEERGQASAIATNILEMFGIKVPIIVIVIGEGGSGGALGIGVGDRVGILENAYYSVITPEGCAAILWKNGERAPEAAEALGLTSERLKDLGIVDTIIPEPVGGAHRNINVTSDNVRAQILTWLEELEGLSTDELLEQRHAKFRGMGQPRSK